MTRRSDIDWERVERLYIAGQMTIRQIAAECDVTYQSITRKAKREGWQRNLGEAIKERTKAKIASIDVKRIVEESAQKSAQQSAQVIRDAIEEASDVAAGVVVRHRADLRLQIERAQRLEALFDDVLATATTTKPVVEFGQDGGERELEAINVGDIQKLSQSFKTIVEARTKLIDKEREAFGITSGQDPAGDDQTDSVELVFVGKLKNAAS